MLKDENDCFKTCLETEIKLTKQKTFVVICSIHHMVESHLCTCEGENSPSADGDMALYASKITDTDHKDTDAASFLK